MPDLAEIGFKADTKELEDASKVLKNELAPAAQKAERASDKLADQMKRTDRASDRLSKGFGRMKTVLLGVVASAAALVSGFAALSFGKFIANTKEANAVQAQLAAALKSTGGVAGQTLDSLNKHAAALQKITNFGDETTNQAQAMLLTFKNIQGDTFPRATTAILDTATAMKTDLKSAAIQVGKALNDPAIGLTALSRSGITFSESQKDVIKNLTETGRLAEAQGIILTELEAQFGGSAKAAREELGGALTSLSNAWGDLFELGTSVTEPFRQAIERLIISIQNPAFVTFIQTIGGAIFGAFTALINATSSLIDGLIRISPILQEIGIAMLIAFGPMIVTTVLSLVGTVASLALAIGTSLVTAIYGAASAMLALTLSNPFTALLYAIPVILAAIYVFRDAISNVLGIDVVAAAKTAANTLISSFVGAFNAVKATWGMFPQVMGEIAINAANFVINAVKQMINNTIGMINSLIAAIPEWLKPGGLSGVPALNMEDALPNPFEGASAQSWKGIASSFSEAFQTDWIGDFTEAMKPMTEQLAIATDGVTALGNAATGEGGGAGGGGGAAAKLTELQRIANDFGTLSEPFNQAQNAFGAAKTALDNGIITNDQYAASLDRIEAAFMRAGGSSGQWAKIVGENTSKVGQQMKDLAENSLTRLGDEFINLAVDGKANFKDLANSIVKDLLRIAYQALVVRPLMNIFGGGGGGAGGGIGGIFKALFSAKGNAFGSNGVQMFADGGAFTNSIVSSPTAFTFGGGGSLGVMGEKDPEAIMPLKRGTDGSLGVQMYGGNRRGNEVSNNVEVNNTYLIEGAVSEEKIITRIRAEGERTKNDVKESVVGWLDQYNRDGAI